MPKYVLDTSLYVYATRSEDWNRELQAFYQALAPSVYLHSVVAGELLAGATSPELERRTRRHLLAPFEATGRLVTPGHEAWKRAGAMVARLVSEKRLSPNGVRRSFLNDCLIAASARDHGLVVVTDNQRDFELIRTVEPVSIAAPWPDPRS